jgi:hypothetical protein
MINDLKFRMLIINVRQRNVQIFGGTQNNFGGTFMFRGTQVEKHWSKTSEIWALIMFL